MTARQVRGIGFLVTGGLFFLAGIVSLAISSTPTWVPIVINAVGVVLNVLGVALEAKPESV